MDDYRQTDSNELFDLLAQHTSYYMKMLSEGASKREFDKCRDTIVDIQTEIEWRKAQQGSPSKPYRSGSTGTHESSHPND